MAPPPTKRNRLNDEEEASTTVDWGKEYLKLQEKLEQSLRANTDLAVKNKELENDVGNANIELLKMKQSLSARGAIELMESKKFKSAPQYCDTRQLKYEWLYNNSKTFYDNVQKCVGKTTVREIGELGKDLYASASHDIHTSFDYGSEVRINRNNYTRPQRNLLEAICNTLNVPFKLYG